MSSPHHNPDEIRACLRDLCKACEQWQLTMRADGVHMPAHSTSEKAAMLVDRTIGRAHYWLKTDDERRLLDQQCDEPQP